MGLLGEDIALSRRKWRVRNPHDPHSGKYLQNYLVVLIILENFIAGIAQLVEHRTCNADVVGSSPIAGSKMSSLLRKKLDKISQVYESI